MMRKKQFYIPISLSKRFDRVNRALAVNGSEIIRRLIYNYTIEKERELSVRVDEVIEIRENFPNDGEAYAVGKANGKYFFAWGAEYPFADKVPSFNIPDGESGIEWHESKKLAFTAMAKAIKAWDTKGVDENEGEENNLQ